MTYQRFNIGNIGAGGISLIDGSTTFALDVIPNAKDLLVEVSFVYNSNEGSTKYGKGFTLNIDETNTQHFTKDGDNITKIFGKDGKKIELNYSSGKLASIKDFDGKYTSFEYDGDKLISITLPNNNGKINFFYENNVIYQITPPLGAGIIIYNSNNSTTLSEFVIIVEGNTFSPSSPKEKIKIERNKQSDKEYKATVQDIDTNIKLDKAFSEYSSENYFRQEKLLIDGDLKQISTEYYCEKYTFNCVQDNFTNIPKSSDFITTSTADQVQNLLNATKGQWVLTTLTKINDKIKQSVQYNSPITKGNTVKSTKISYVYNSDGKLKEEKQEIFH